MKRLEVVEYLAREVLDSTDNCEELEANVDFDMAALTEEVHEKAQELAETLNCKINTPAMADRIRRAWCAWQMLSGWGAHGDPPNHISVDYEHGQWWVTHLPSGAQWSVIDAEGSLDCQDGFDFEEVTAHDFD